jgi:hypothetical protein
MKKGEFYNQFAGLSASPSGGSNHAAPASKSGSLVFAHIAAERQSGAGKTWIFSIMTWQRPVMPRIAVHRCRSFTQNAPLPPQAYQGALNIRSRIAR